MRFDGRPAVKEVSLEVAPGEICCLLGPSGCGKSTTLRIAAGVERQQSGQVAVDGVEMSGPGLHQPPEARSVGLMFQDFALFPHLTVAENITFGLRGARRAERAAAVAHYLERVGLQGYDRSYPHQLSGGEQQRVALARALAPKPRVMLMDEPFSGLDNRLRDEVRDETLSILKSEGAAVLMVTHEPAEAMRMADRIALMRGGRIVQIGAPLALYDRPVDKAAAAFFSDINTIPAVVRAGAAETPFGAIPAPGMVDGVKVDVVIRPQHVTIAEDTGAAAVIPAGVADTVLGTVLRACFLGHESMIECRLAEGGGQIRATLPHAWLPEEGSAVRLSLRRDHCFVFPSANQAGVENRLAAE
ncbi:MAG: ABC transporter ATP-binding protein [Pseudomonadota bacterium]